MAGNLFKRTYQKYNMQNHCLGFIIWDFYLGPWRCAAGIPASEKNFTLDEIPMSLS